MAGADVPRPGAVTLLVDPDDPDHVMIRGLHHITDGYEVSLMLLAGLWGAVFALRIVAAVRRRTRRPPATDRLPSTAGRPTPGDAAA
jgi:hypothetical protein